MFWSYIYIYQFEFRFPNKNDGVAKSAGIIHAVNFGGLVSWLKGRLAQGKNSDVNRHSLKINAKQNCSIKLMFSTLKIWNHKSHNEFNLIMICNCAIENNG